MKIFLKTLRFLLVLVVITGWVFQYPPIFGGQGWPSLNIRMSDVLRFPPEIQKI